MADKSEFLVACLPKDRKWPIHIVHVGNENRMETDVMEVGGNIWSATLFFKGSLFVIGGSQCNSYEAFEIDLYSGRRRRVLDLGTPRGWSHQLVNKGDDIFAIGGHDFSFGNCNTCEVYHARSNRWEYLPSMLRGRLYFPVVILPDGRLFAIGGDNEIWRKVEMLNPTRTHWREMAPMRKQRQHHAAVWFEGYIVVVGGDYHVKIAKRYTVEIFSPPDVNSDSEIGQWTRISSLSRGMDTYRIVTLPDNEILVFGLKGEMEKLKRKSKPVYTSKLNKLLKITKFRNNEDEKDESQTPSNPNDSKASHKFKEWKWKNVGNLKTWNYYNIDAVRWPIMH